MKLQKILQVVWQVYIEENGQRNKFLIRGWMKVQKGTEFSKMI